MECVSQNDIPVVQDNKIDFTAHLQRERRNTLYHLLNPDAPRNSLTAEFDNGLIAFPDYSQVLFLHGFDRPDLVAIEEGEKKSLAFSRGPKGCQEYI